MTSKRREAGQTEQRHRKPTDEPLFYVGVGASAGGLQAIDALFEVMPVDSGLAFVVVQHLSPDYKSMMVELLSKKTAMPVIRANDGLVVAPNTIYLIPPKANLTIFHGKLLLSEQDHTRGLNLPIDIFLRSLAEDQGRRAIGVVLSGTGSDGMRGLRAIKEAGGMVMIQSIESAKFDGMPRAAISTGVADFILPPEKMADHLVRYAHSPHAARSAQTSLAKAETDLDRIFAMLRDDTKVDFTHYKPSTVSRRIERRMTVNRVDALHDYVHLLEQDHRELTTLYRELLIGVTSFFRDPEAFEILRTQVIPDLFKDPGKIAYRFWIAGCSTGEEAYSLAMVCRECMEEMDTAFDVKIFATDVDQEAVLTAGAGTYPASLVADLPKSLRNKYFNAHGSDFQVKRSLREQIVFAQHNVLSDPPFTKIDLISCRNLLIYLEPVLQEKVLELFGFSLNPSGILFLGSSETTGRHVENFEVIHQKWRIYKSLGRPRPINECHDPKPLFRVSGSRNALSQLRPARRTDAQESRLQERLLCAVVSETVPLVLVVNENLELVYSVGDSSNLLAVPTGHTQYRVGKMMPRELSIPLTSSVQRAFRKNQDVTFTNIRFTQDNTTWRLNLRVKPLETTRTQEPLAAVLIEDVGKKAESEKEPDESASFDMEDGVKQRLAELEQELQFTKENLQATIEELETSNEELQATNEELLASNQELQSTNEELQSVNEELHTVNSEHQLKILELTEMTNDLDNLLHNTRQGTLFLDENQEIRKFTPEISQVLRIQKVDVGRPLDHISHRLVDCGHPVEFAGRVLETGTPVEREVQNDEGKTFLMRVLPYEIAHHEYSGLVLTFVDLSRLKRMEAALADSQRRLSEAANLARVGSWTYVPETGQHLWSEEVYAIHDLPVGQQPTPEEGIAFYSEASRPVITRAFEAACRQGTPYDEVLQIVTAKGRKKWVRAIGNPIVEGGRVVRINGAFQDITKVKNMEREIEDLKERQSD